MPPSPPHAMISFTLKIRRFLESVDVSFDERISPSMQLISYFEREYDMSVMNLLEREWVDEQIQRDVSRGYFRELRQHVPMERVAEFDEDVAILRDHAA